MRVRVVPGDANPRGLSRRRLLAAAGESGRGRPGLGHRGRAPAAASTQGGRASAWEPGLDAGRRLDGRLHLRPARAPTRPPARGRGPRDRGGRSGADRAGWRLGGPAERTRSTERLPIPAGPGGAQARGEGRSTCLDSPGRLGEAAATCGGWYVRQGSPALFVSRGLGTVIPIRIGSPPELAIFRLRPGATAPAPR